MKTPLYNLQAAEEARHVCIDPNPSGAVEQQMGALM